MSAEVLRRAASLMRERAEACLPGPWAPYETGAHRCISANHRYGSRLRQVGYATEACPEFADHAASWHPAVALAVADWLDLCADACTSPDEKQGAGRTIAHADEDHALAVARAYLGAES